jgi:hypothetical protein
MAKISVENWWRAHEIPLVETDWRNIKLYCGNTEDVWNWSHCVYFVRLAPPFQIAYGNNDAFHSPLVYIGKGSIRQRWGHHCKTWLRPLGHWLPGARYELWAFDNDRYDEIESDALLLFREKFDRLPLANRRREQALQIHEYDESFYQVAAPGDRRYWWALRPTQPDVKEYFDSGAIPADDALP